MYTHHNYVSQYLYYDRNDQYHNKVCKLCKALFHSPKAVSRLSLNKRLHKELSENRIQGWRWNN